MNKLKTLFLASLVISKASLSASSIDQINVDQEINMPSVLDRIWNFSAETPLEQQKLIDEALLCIMDENLDWYTQRRDFFKLFKYLHEETKNTVIQNLLNSSRENSASFANLASILGDIFEGITKEDQEKLLSDIWDIFNSQDISIYIKHSFFYSFGSLPPSLQEYFLSATIESVSSKGGLFLEYPTILDCMLINPHAQIKPTLITEALNLIDNDDFEDSNKKYLFTNFHYFPEDLKKSLTEKIFNLWINGQKIGLMHKNILSNFSQEQRIEFLSRLSQHIHCVTMSLEDRIHILTEFYDLLPEEKDHFLNEMFSYIEEIAANPTPENKYILAKIIIPQSLGFLQNATNDQERFLNLIEKIAYIDFDSNPEEEIVDKIFFMNQDSYIILKNGRLTLQHGSDPLDRWNFHGNIAFNANKKFVFVDADHLSLDNHSTASNLRNSFRSNAVSFSDLNSMHQDMIFRIIRKSFENISTSFVNRDLIEGLVYFIHESDPQKVLELISSVYQQPDFKEKYGKRFGSLIDFIETTGYSASSQNNLDIIRTAYTQKEIDVVTLNAIIFANPKNLEAILTEDLPIKYFADTLKYDGRLSVSPEEIKERFVSKILEAAKKREISAKEFFSLWGRLMRYTETSGHHSVTEMALELSSLPDNPFALTVDLFMSSFAFSSEEKKRELTDTLFQNIGVLGQKSPSQEQVAFLTNILTLTYRNPVTLLKDKLPDLLAKVFELTNPDWVTNIYSRLTVINMLLELSPEVRERAIPILKNLMKDPSILSLNPHTKEDLHRQFHTIELTQDEKDFVEILEKKLNFELAHVRLNNADFGNPDGSYAVNEAKLYLQKLLDEENQDRKFLEKEEYTLLLSNISNFLNDRLLENKAEETTTTIGKSISPDIIDIAKENFNEMMESISYPNRVESLWFKKPDPTKISILDHNGQNITLGRIIQLVFDKIQEKIDHPLYPAFAAAFINALGSEAIIECGTGAIGHMVRSLEALFKPAIKDEERRFTQEDRNRLTSAEFPALKQFIIDVFNNNDTKHPEWLENSTMSYFINHVTDHITQIQNDKYIASLFLDTGFKVYISEYYESFIRNGSLKRDEIDTYIEMIESF